MHEISQVILYVAITCLIAAFAIALFATWRFSHVLIKLVALEVLVNLFIAAVGLWALRLHFSYFLDICIALSLLMFLSTVAYCQFIVRQGSNHV